MTDSISQSRSARQDTHDYRARRLYVASKKCVRVPLKYTRPGFEVLRFLGGTGQI
jgi:hypothetical protein